MLTITKLLVLGVLAGIGFDRISVHEASAGSTQDAQARSAVQQSLVLTAADGSEVVLKAESEGRLVISHSASDRTLEFAERGIDVKDRNGVISIGTDADGACAVTIRNPAADLVCSLSVGQDRARVHAGTAKDSRAGAAIEWTTNRDGGVEVFDPTGESKQECNYAFLGRRKGYWGVRVGDRVEHGIEAADRIRLLWADRPDGHGGMAMLGLVGSTGEEVSNALLYSDPVEGSWLKLKDSRWYLGLATDDRQGSGLAVEEKTDDGLRGRSYLWSRGSRAWMELRSRTASSGMECAVEDHDVSWGVTMDDRPAAAMTIGSADPQQGEAAPGVRLTVLDEEGEVLRGVHVMPDGTVWQK